MKKHLLNIAFICFAALEMLAAPFVGKVQQFKQPNGNMVDVKLFGNEYYMRAEGLDGYTLVRDTATGYICYAKLSVDSKNLISTGIIYTGISNDVATLRDDLPVSKHIDILPAAQKEKVQKNRLLLEGNANANEHSVDRMGTPITPVSGYIKGLCIVVDFADEVGNLPMSEFDDFCNNLNYNNFGNNGSLRKFYQDISGGIVDYQNVVFGYYRAPLTFAQYDAMNYAEGAQDILGQALNWIASTGFDFSTLSINTDGTIRAINLMYTGNPPNWAEGMWFHKGYYDSFSANGVSTGDYNCSPANNPLTLATVAHENGHMIGKWPDTYKYESTTGPDGIGAFDLMCWYGSETNPVTPNPLFRSNAGWGRVVDVTNYNGINTDTADSRTCFKYTNLNDTNEFFLLENRIRMGRNTTVPNQGLTIWHIDRNGDNQTTHHEVWLEHANNNYNNENAACFRSGFHPEYSFTTTPGSKFYNGDPSGLRVWDIGGVDTIMTYKLGKISAAPVLNVLYNSLTADNNGNGFLEPAESATINVSALNTGQLNSAPAILTCTSVGASGSLVTVNTAPIAMGVINMGQSIAAAFNVTLSANIQAGTEISLRFTLSDGTDSIYITRKYTVGVQVLMGNQTISNCASVFLDSGGESATYSNNQDFVTTFYPANAGDFIHATFLAFDLEDEPTCANDYLYIYNGPNTNSPFIDAYCGTNNPGQIISTDITGALTFEFHSNDHVRGAGWKAAITCAEYVGIKNNIITQVAINPNPSTGNFNIAFNQPTIAQIQIMDALGNILYNQASNQQTKHTVDMSNQSNGIYFIKIMTAQELITKKIVLNK